MKVFWSWQSDHEGKVSRHFIRDALEQAIEALKEVSEVEDSPREPLNHLHLDHDRKGVPGSPDLAATIFSKIDKTNVFVADVTPVAVSSRGRKVMNPNVAIELGYAIKSLSSEKVVMIMNLAYGEYNDLPFDLKHKAFPITYFLPEDADKSDVKREAGKLIGKLKGAIVSYIDGVMSEESGKDLDRSWELMPKSSPACFVDANEVLCRYQEDSGQEPLALVWSGTPAIFLRLIPKVKQSTFRSSYLKDAIVQNRGASLSPFGRSSGMDWGPNAWGAICFSRIGGQGSTTIGRFTQVSNYGEIWGVDFRTLGEIPNSHVPWFEEMFEAYLRQYIRFSVETLNILPPFSVVCGMVGIEGRRVVLPPPPQGRSYMGDGIGSVAQRNHVVWTGTIDDIGKVRSCLLPFYHEVWDAFGETRREWLPTTD